MTLVETSKLIASIVKMWPSWGEKRDLDGTTRMWAKAFADDDAQLVGQALGVYFTTDVTGFAPVPGQLKEIMAKMRQGDGELTEQEAWNLVYRAICNSAYNSDSEFRKLPAVCQTVVGSPEALHDWAIMDADEVLSVVASNFMRSYRIRAQHHRDMEKLPESMRALMPALSQIGRLPSEKAAALPPAPEEETFVAMPEEIRKQLASLFGVRT